MNRINRTDERDFLIRRKTGSGQGLAGYRYPLKSNISPRPLVHKNNRKAPRPESRRQRTNSIPHRLYQNQLKRNTNKNYRNGFKASFQAKFFYQWGDDPTGVSSASGLIVEDFEIITGEGFKIDSNQNRLPKIPVQQRNISIQTLDAINTASSTNPTNSINPNSSINPTRPSGNQNSGLSEVKSSDSGPNGKIAFVCLMIWTFVLIGRPQDYFSLLTPLRPALLSAAATLFSMMLSRVRIPNGFKSLIEVRLLSIFYIVMIVGIPFAVHKRVAFDFVFTIFPTTLIFFFVFLILVNSVKRLMSIALIGVIGAVLSSFMYAKDTVLAGNMGQRVYASQMYDPNDIAFVFATFLPLTLYFFFSRRSLGPKLFFFIAGLSMAAGIVITQSRGGILALSVIILSLLILKTDVWRSKKKFLAILLLISCMIYFYPIVKNRFQNIQSDYNISEQGGRIAIWKENLGIFLHNPVFGVGANCSAVALGFQRAKNSAGYQAWQVTHSSIIQVAVETGVLGLIIYTMLNLKAIANFRRLQKKLNSDLSLFAFFMEISFYGFWTSALFLTHGYSINLFFLLAMSASMRSLANNAKLPLNQQDRVDQAEQIQHGTGMNRG